MDTKRFPKLIKDIYCAVKELEEMFTDKTGQKRHFTPDGHMVGSIGEVLAAYHYGIKLFAASEQIHDGEIDNRKVQIKATQRTSVNMSGSVPDFLIVLKITKDGEAQEVYNGPGNLIKSRKLQKNGQYKISIKKLRDLMGEVDTKKKIKVVHPISPYLD